MIGSARSNKLTNNSEVSTQPYYTHSQGYWLGYEPIDKDKAVALATAMKQACDNNKILYSQPLREEGWKNFKTSIKDIKKITHVDCSSLVRLCIRQAFNVKLPNELSAENQAVKARAIGDAGRHIHNFWLSDSVYSDRCRIVINDAASMSYEQDKDASKFMSTNADVPQIYSVGSGVAYAINEMPLGEGIVPIAIYAGNNTELTLHYEAGANAMGEVVLVDAQEGKSYELEDGDVELSVEAYSVVSGRYYISFVGGTTAIEKIANDKTLSSDSGKIYDLQGRQVSTKQKNGVYIQNGMKFYDNKP